MNPSSHPDPDVRERANQLLIRAGYSLDGVGDKGDLRKMRAKLRLLRIRAYLVWPLVMFFLVELGWFLKARSAALSWVVFAVLIWVLFFRACRAQRALTEFRCPRCGERFFYSRLGWYFGIAWIWSNRCKHCACRAD